MSAKTKPEKAQADKQPRQTPKPIVLAAWLLFGTPRGATWTLLIVLAFAGFAYSLWQREQVQVAAHRDYQIEPTDVDITPLPQWIRADLTAEALASLGRDARLSILDEKLSETVYNAFTAHPWVAKVERVAKKHPARLQVDLEYRRPVCMVEVPRGAAVSGAAPVAFDLLPVDVKGVLLPERDFSSQDKERYPRLGNIASAPLGGPGVRWGDARVTGGAEVAAALVEAWNELSLARIVPSPTSQGPSSEEYSYEIFTTGGTQIIWGYSPNSRVAGEVAAVDKVDRLRQLHRQRGTLEGPQGPQRIDLRDWRQAKVSERPARTVAVPTAQPSRE